ncbi:MAG TPA: tetratricopeptide repeat protein [Planctomycetota bacterium]|nr:tetratricopeptide repeat protein [Planctomycetota bacterium]
MIPARLRTPLALAAILAAVALSYGPAVRGAGFVYDDLLLVERNAEIRDPANLPHALTRGFWDVANPNWSKQIGFYRPLVTVLLTAGWQISGPAPWGYHLVAVSLHAAACVLGFLLARRLARSDGIAFGAALLFATHPIHAESVTWISGISDVSCAVFLFASLLAYLRWRDRGGGGLPWPVAPLSLLALSGKEMALSLLPLSLALDAAFPVPSAPGTRLARFRPLARYLPFLLAYAVYLGLRVHAYGDWRAGLDRQPTHLFLEAHAPWRSWTLPFELFAGYLGRLAAPLEPNAFVVLRLDRGPMDPHVLAPIAVGLAYAFALTRARRAGPGVLAGALWFAVSTLPVVVRPESIGQFLLSERFAYVPSLGFCLAAAALAARGLALLPSPALRRAIGAVSLVAVSAFLGSRTILRNRDFRDERAFFEAARAASPDSATVRWSLGRVYSNAARAQRDPRRAAELWGAARAEFEAALDVDASRWHVSVEDWTQANLGQAWTYLAEGSLEVAEPIFRKTLEWQRRRGVESAEVHSGLGACALARKDFRAAEEEFGTAIRLNPRDESARYNLGVVYQERGDFRKAADAFQRALEINPNHFAAAMRLGQVLYHLNDRPLSVRYYERALAIDPNHPDAPLVRDALDYIRRGG